MDEDVIGGRVSLGAEDGERGNFHRSVRALPAAPGHAGHITCRYDIAGHSLNEAFAVQSVACIKAVLILGQCHLRKVLDEYARRL